MSKRKRDKPSRQHDCGCDPAAGAHGAAGTTTDQPACDCCTGVAAVTPLPTDNPPGLGVGALSARVGTHGAFVATMTARLSGESGPGAVPPDDDGGTVSFPLRRLRARGGNDPATAMIDAWALVADVLAFYNERIVNEGYLRTAVHRRSLVELARLVGYKPRPGVAASVYLAFSLDAPVPPPGAPPAIPGIPTAEPAAAAPTVAAPVGGSEADEVVVPRGTLARSQPGQGELPEPFESSDDLRARPAWNELKPRMSRPQDLKALPAVPLYLSGTATNLKVNDPLLVDGPTADGKGVEQRLFRVVRVTPDNEAGRTRVDLEVWNVTQNLIDRVRAIETEATGIDSELDKAVKELVEEMKPGAATSGVVARLDALIPELAARVETMPEAAAAKALGVLPTLMDFRARVRTPFDVPSVDAAGEKTSWHQVVENLLKAPAGDRPRSSAELPRDLGNTIGFSSKDTLRRSTPDLATALLAAMRPELRPQIYQAWRNVRRPPAAFKAYAFRVRAQPFGHNAPPKSTVVTEKPAGGKQTTTITYSQWELGDKIDEFPHEIKAVSLAGSFPQIREGSWVVVDRPANAKTIPTVPVIATAPKVSEGDKTAYGMTGPATRLELDADWIGQDVDTFAAVIPKTIVYAQSERLELAEEPVDDDVCGDRIELSALYDGLQSGRWLIVAGERSESDAGAPGVRAAELVMLRSVEQRPDPASEEGNTAATTGGDDDGDGPRAGDAPHSHLRLYPALVYCYKRDTVTIHGNVVHATHGETRRQVLGGGDGSGPLQTFTLRQSPLTWVAAANPLGVESTLAVRVNDVLWHEEPDLFGLGPNDRAFITKTGDDGVTSVTFGTGREGARPPTGVENIRAQYRVGIGRGGNVRAGRISVLGDKPPGVKSVVNPLPAAGGADRESADAIRQNAPLGITALGRLVSLRDYEDFARAFAGIAKASSARLSDGSQMLVHLTVAGVGDVRIDRDSDLYRNLVLALQRYGDPNLPVAVAPRGLVLLVLEAAVRVHPDYLWEKVEPKVRAALLDRFGFDRQELARPVYLSAVLAVVQAVEGVEYVDADTFGGVSDTNRAGDPATPVEILAAIQTMVNETADGLPDQRVDALPARPGGGGPARILPAQVACFTPDVPDTLILKEIR